jgi:biopolymer transport protein ExbD
MAEKDKKDLGKAAAANAVAPELLPPDNSKPVPEEEQRKPRKGSRTEKHEYPLNITAMMDMMTIILVYLLKSYSSDPGNITTSNDLQLANSSSRFRVEEAVPVAISKKSIMVNDRIVAPVENGKVASTYKDRNQDNSYLITPLMAAMKAEAEKQKNIAKYNKSKEFKGLVLIVGDKMVPYRLLTEVLYTVGQAEFGQYKFVVTVNE